MITVGLDFGTHQTKICYETLENGRRTYDVFQFPTPRRHKESTLPSLIYVDEFDLLHYGYDAMDAMQGSVYGRAITYFKQKMFSSSISDTERDEAKHWAILYLTYIIIKLDMYFKKAKNAPYIVQMGMPTSAEPSRYIFCKCQAISAMATAMLLARDEFHGDMFTFLHNTPYSQLRALVNKYLTSLPSNIEEIRKTFPILVFPEAYASLIPLINDHKLPDIGLNLFVDIGGGTVDISLFTNQMDWHTGQERPCLHYYDSVPYGLNMITGQNINKSHIVKIAHGQVSFEGANRFRQKLITTLNHMMSKLRELYEQNGKGLVMPFQNFCLQTMDKRPICYSGGGSLFDNLRVSLEKEGENPYYFTDVKKVSSLIDHSEFPVNKEMIPVLATAFALSHESLRYKGKSEAPDALTLVPLGNLVKGVKLAQAPMTFKKAPKW